MRSNEQKNNVRKMIIILCMAVIMLALLTTCCTGASTTGDDHSKYAGPVTYTQLSGTLGANGWYTDNVTVTLTVENAENGVQYTKYKMVNWTIGDSSGWLYRKNITILHSKIDATLTNFPVLVNLTTANFNFSKVNTNGSDIRFADDAGNLLNYEIENWTANTSAMIWVNVSSISNVADTTLFMYYGNSSATDAQNPAKVWDSNFLMVQHFEEQTGSIVRDSTVNRLNGTVSGTTFTSSQKIDGSRYFNGVSDYISFPDSDLWNFGANPYTIECWFRNAGNTVLYPSIIANAANIWGNGGWRMSHNNGGSGELLGLYWQPAGNPFLQSATVFPNNQWHYYCVSRNTSNTFTMYGNAANQCVGTSTSAFDLSNGGQMFVGKNGWDGANGYWFGYIDELRISNVCRNASWLNATYYSSNGTLLCFGGEETKANITANIYSTDNITWNWLDNSVWNNYTVPFVVSAEGIHTLHYYSVDNGNHTETEKLTNIKIDKTSPTIPLVNRTGTTGTNGWCISNVTFTPWNSTDSASGLDYYQYSFDTITWYNGTHTFSSDITDLDIAFRAVNGAGIVSDIIWCNNTKIDVTPPQTQVYPINQDAPYVTGVPFTLSWGGIDNTSGLQYYDVEYKVGIGSSWQSLLYHTIDNSTSFSALSEGQTAYFRCRAADMAGNIEDWPASSEGDVNVSIDNTAPITTESHTGTSGLNSWYTSNVSVALACSDSVSGVNYTEYKINDGPWTVYVDTTAPYITSTTPANGATCVLNQNIIISFGETMNTSSVLYSCFPNPSGWIGSWNSPANDTLTLTHDNFNSGTTYTFNVTAGKDVAGHDLVPGAVPNPWTFTATTKAVSVASTNIGAEKSGSGITLTDDGTYTIYYRSVDKAGNTESTKSITIKIDKTPPMTSSVLIGTAGENEWFTTTVEVSLSSADATSGADYIKYSWDNITFYTYNSGSRPTRDADGTYTVYFNGVDYAGVVELTKSAAFKIDKTAPTTVDSSDTNWHNTDVIIALTPSDAISGINTTVYGINDNTCPNTGTTITISTEGINTFYYKSKNNAGLWENTKSCTVKIDKTAPTTTVSLTPSTADGENGWYVSDITVSLSSADTPSGVSDIKYRINNGSWNTYTTTFALTADGNYSVDYYAADAAFNNETIKNAAVKIDKSTPTGTIAINNDAQSTNSTAVTLTLSSTDATSGTAYMQFSNDAAIWSGWENYSTSKVWTLTSGADGTRNVHAQYKDNAGKIATLSDTIILDTTPPTTAISFTGTAGANGWYTTGVTITLSASDTLSGVSTTKYKTDSGTWQSYATPIDFLTVEGTFTFYYYSVDNIGNAEAEKNITVKTDKTAPAGTVVINSGATYTTTRYVTLALTATDATSQIWQMCFSSDGTSFTSWESYSTTKNYTLTAGDEQKTVHFKVRDCAGNEYVANDSITLDMTPPTIRITNPSNHGSYTSNPSLTITGTIDDTDITNAVLRFNGVNSTITVTSGVFSQAVTLISGLNTINVTATDAAGNTGGSDGSITLDISVPSLTVSSPTNNFITNTPSIIVAGTTNATGITLTVNSISVTVNGDGTFNYTYIPTADGQITISVKAANQAGTATFVNRTGIVDTAAPSKPIELTVSPLSWTNYNVFTLNWTNPADTSSIKGEYYKIGGQPINNIDGTYTVAKPLVINAPADGSYIVYLWLVDYANNVNYNNRESITIYYDGTAPNMPNLTYPRNSDAISDSTPTFTWESLLEGSSGLKNYEITVDNNFDFTSPEFTASPTTSEATAAALADGLYYWKVRAVDNANNIGSWSNMWSFRIDSSLPGITNFVINSNALYTNTTSVSLTIQADNASYMCFSNNGTVYSAWEPYATLKLWNLTADDGIKTVYAKVKNLANVSSGAAYDTITLDVSAPAASESHSGTLGTNDWYVSSVVVTLIASDATSGVSQILFRYKTGDWTAWNIYSSPFTLSLDAEYTLEYYAVDNATNAEAVKNVTIKIDKTKPETTAAKTPATPELNNWYTSDVTINLTAADGTSGIYVIKYRLNGGAWLIYTTEIILTADGTHTIEYNATDLAGNVEVTKSLTIQIDSTAPASAEQHNGTAGSGGWYLSDVIAYLIASDNTSGIDYIKYKLGAGEWQIYTTTITLSADCTHTVYFYSTDKAGNSEPEKNITIKIDRTKPVSNAVLDPVTPNGMNSYYRTAVAVTLTATDATSGIKEIQYKLNNGTWQLYSETLSISADGSYVVYYYAIDNAGNTESIKNVSFKIDQTPPTTAVVINGTGTNNWYGANTTITLSANEPAVIYFRWDNYIYQYYINQISAAEGTHTLYYYSTDSAGNVETEKSREIKVDTTLPVCNIVINNGAAYTNTTLVTLTLTYSDQTTSISQVRCSNDGVFNSEVEDWQLPGLTKQWTLSAEDGNKTVYFEVCDEAGNTAMASATIILDDTPPSITVSFEGNYTGAIYSSEVLCTITVSDMTSYTVVYKINDGEWQNYTNAILFTESKKYELYIKATDAAGNSQLSYGAITINRTILNPTVTISSVTTVQASEIISLNWTALDPQGQPLNITIAIDGVNISVPNTGSAEIPTVNLTNGNHTLEMIAINEDGRRTCENIGYITVNNKFVREINVSQSGVQGMTIPISVLIRNYAPEPKFLTIVFYDGDTNIGSSQVFLQSLETQIITINYTLQHASEHTIFVKVFDENNNKIDSASAVIIVSLSELQIQQAMNPAWLIALGVAFFVGMAVVSLLIKRRRQKRLNEGEEGEE